MRVFSYFLLTAIFFTSCSVANKFGKQRGEIGIPTGFVYTSQDSLYMMGPTKWYLHNYKKKDSVEVTDQFVKIEVWILQTEVTNSQYNRFLSSLRKDSLFEEYNLYKPDHSGWTNIDSLNPFYIQMAAEYDDDKYLEYPVVNLSKKAISAYIAWLNKMEPSKNVMYKLPDGLEWKKGFNDTDINDSTYSWGHNMCQNAKNKLLGNFALLDPEQWRYDHLTNKFSFDNLKNQGYLSRIEGPMDRYSFNPSMMGTYNMSGNVAELITIANDTIADIAWTKGGSWLSVPHSGKKHTWERYQLPSPCVGFRVVKYNLVKEGTTKLDFE